MLLSFSHTESYRSYILLKYQCFCQALAQKHCNYREFCCQTSQISWLWASEAPKPTNSIYNILFLLRQCEKNTKTQPLLRFSGVGEILKIRCIARTRTRTRTRTRQEQQQQQQEEEEEAAQKCDQEMCYKLRYKQNIRLCSAPARKRRAHEQHQRSH